MQAVVGAAIAMLGALAAAHPDNAMLQAMLHYGSAIVLFTMFAVYSLWLFRFTEPGGLRSSVYVGCGILIVVGMGWAAYERLRGRSIFLPESLVLVAFAVSWLVKGSVHRTLARGVRAISGRS